MACLFTIEQIELIRRLRKTGMTKEQVWRAFEEMDRMEYELGPNENTHDSAPNSCNMSAVPSATKLVNNNNNSNDMINGPQSMNIQSDCSLSLCPNEEVGSNKNHFQISSHAKNSVPQIPGSNPLSHLERSKSLPPISQSSMSQCFSNIQPNVTNIDLSDDDSLKETSMRVANISSNEIPSNSLVPINKHQENNHFGQEEPQELIEFKRKGETVMLNEIRTFVNKYNIRQIMIAEMTRISQGYVSRFFRGEGQDMSEKSKNLIYLWYLTCKNRPEILTQFCPQTIGERRTLLTESGDLLPIRRDRFIFRREHLLILDKYFKENPYPDASTKEMIANECNQVVERLTKKTLKERDKVSISVVSNWFNNKRKEAKTKKQTTRDHHNSHHLQHETSSSSPSSATSSQTLQFASQTNIFSVHNNNEDVEEVESRPDILILNNCYDHQPESIDLCEDNEDNDNSQQSYSIDFSPAEYKPTLSIKMEPTY